MRHGRFARSHLLRIENFGKAADQSGVARGARGQACGGGERVQARHVHLVVRPLLFLHHDLAGGGIHLRGDGARDRGACEIEGALYGDVCRRSFAPCRSPSP